MANVFSSAVDWIRTLFGSWYSVISTIPALEDAIALGLAAMIVLPIINFLLDQSGNDVE